MGTFEAVLTTPISETKIVLVKFISAFIFYLILWLPALIYCGVLHGLCSSQGVVFLDAGILVASFTGVILIGLFYNAVGLLMSAFTTNQVVAAIAGFTILFSSLLVFMMLGYSTQYEWVRRVGQFFSTFAHMLDFSRGVIDSRVVLLYLGSSIWMILHRFEYWNGSGTDEKRLEKMASSARSSEYWTRFYFTIIFIGSFDTSSVARRS